MYVRTRIRVYTCGTKCLHFGTKCCGNLARTSDVGPEVGSEGFGGWSSEKLCGEWEWAVVLLGLGLHLKVSAQLGGWCMGGGLGKRIPQSQAPSVENQGGGKL